MSQCPACLKVHGEIERCSYPVLRARIAELEKDLAAQLDRAVQWQMEAVGQTLRAEKQRDHYLVAIREFLTALDANDEAVGWFSRMVNKASEKEIGVRLAASRETLNTAVSALRRIAEEGKS